MVLFFIFKTLRHVAVSWGYLIGIALILTTALAGFWFYGEILQDLPSANEIYNPPTMSTKILDRNGKLLYKFYEDENRSWVSLKQVPQSLIWATLAIEDKDFYNHHGISAKGVVKAVLFDLKKDEGEKLRGGSTITQQLVKNVFFGNEQSWQRKVKEAILAILVERKLTKDEILERYFNQVAYGGDTYGVQEAAWKYFGKSVWELNMAETSFLAGIPASPSSYSPYGIKRKYAFERQEQVIEQMVDGKYITVAKADELRNVKLEILPEKKLISAPHFVFFIKDLMEKKYGYANFGRQGLTISTSLDLNTQKMAESITKNEVSAINRLRITNGAALVLDVKTGDILAMVGSKDYYANDIEGKFNVTTALRQPGSSIKPINYLLALQKGMSLASSVDDSPVTYDIKGQKPYSPQNYNGKFMGNVTLRTALASSLNVPSVKLLAQNGIDNMINLATMMGITSWTDRSRYGLALALGGGEVRMIELAQAYSVFANLGEKVEVNPILEVKNYLGETIYEKQIEKTRIVEPELAFLIDDALSDDNARAPIFGLNSKLHIEGRTVAVKTGTTNILRDNWCIGWTPDVLVAVWVGNNDNSPMSWVASGVTGATPIWNKIIREVIKDKPNESWDKPQGLSKSKVCGREEYLLNGSENKIKCLTPQPAVPTTRVEAHANRSD